VGKSGTTVIDVMYVSPAGPTRPTLSALSPARLPVYTLTEYRRGMGSGND
jgi:hypothetical protein